MKKVSRRQMLRTAGAVTGTTLLASVAGCEKRGGTPPRTGDAAAPGDPVPARDVSNEEYVWVSANTNLPLFVARDHVALTQVGAELGVRVSIAGPNTVDIPGLVAAVEQTAARKPAGIMVIGWDPSALIPAINQAVESGVPVVCVDADVPASKRLSFVGTDWTEVGRRQGEAMVKALGGRGGKVGMLGLIEQTIDQQAFAGFRSIAERANLIVMEPQQDRGNQGDAARVASAIIQANPDLVGLAGFDSESGPGIGQAIKEAGRAGQIVATCVECEAQHLQLIQEGVLTAAVCQKRELFTYQGVKALYEIVHSKLRFTADDVKAGISPIPVNYNTGTFTITKENVGLLTKPEA